MSGLAKACASGAVGALQKLFLNNNQIGEAGMTAFAGAIGTNGALPALKAVYLFNNPGDGEPVKKALADRKEA